MRQMGSHWIRITRHKNEEQGACGLGITNMDCLQGLSGINCDFPLINWSSLLPYCIPDGHFDHTCPVCKFH